MEFVTVAEAAERMGVSARAIQKWAKSGKIAGAKQIGRSWVIPADAPVPNIRAKSRTPRVSGKRSAKDKKIHLPFPLMCLPFASGDAQKAVDSITDEDDRAIALGELYYFSGQYLRSIQQIEPYLQHEDPSLSISANLLYVFDCLGLGRIEDLHRMVEYIRQRTRRLLSGEVDSVVRGGAILLDTTVAILLRVPDVDIHRLEQTMDILPRALQLFGCYILAYRAYMEQDYHRSCAICRTALLLGGHHYPLVGTNLQIMRCVSLMCLREVEEAKYCFNSLWENAQKDHSIGQIGEHYLMLLGLPDLCLKQQKPDEFKQLMEITKQYYPAWLKIREQIDNAVHATGLTVTEMNIAALYNRNWAVKEIAVHMDISERMVKHHVAMIYEKLGVGSREELRKYTFL